MPLWPQSGLWRHGDFLRLWGAQTISQFGSQVTALALPLVAVITLDASALEVAVLGAVEFLPFLLFSLPAGVWVDRLRRRPILVVSDVGRAIALATMPLAYALDVLTIWQLYVVGFAVGVLTVFFDVAYQSYLPSLVQREQLVEGNSKLEISRSGAQVAGPGIAGVLIGAVTAPIAILVDAVSFVVSGILVVAIRKSERPAAVTETRRSMRKEIAEGLRFVIQHPFMRPSMLFVATSNFCTQVMFSVFLVYAVRDLEMTPGEIGLAFALGNLGFLAGAMLAGRASGWFGLGRTMVASAFTTGAGLFLVPLAPPSLAIPFVAGALAVAGLGGVVYNVTGLSLMQAVTPERMLGRMNASRRFVVWGVIPLGALTGGAVASALGLRAALWLGAAGASVAFLPLLLSPVRALDRVPEPEPSRA